MRPMTIQTGLRSEIRIARRNTVVAVAQERRAAGLLVEEDGAVGGGHAAAPSVVSALWRVSARRRAASVRSG